MLRGWKCGCIVSICNAARGNSSAKDADCRSHRGSTAAAPGSRLLEGQLARPPPAEALWWSRVSLLWLLVTPALRMRSSAHPLQARPEGSRESSTMTRTSKSGTELCMVALGPQQCRPHPPHQRWGDGLAGGGVVEDGISAQLQPWQRRCPGAGPDPGSKLATTQGRGHLSARPELLRGPALYPGPVPAVSGQ